MGCVYITKQTMLLILILASYPSDFTTVPFCIIRKVKEKNEDGEEEKGKWTKANDQRWQKKKED